MQVTEVTVDSYEEEGITLSYMELTRDFAEIRDYCLHKGETIIGYTESKEAVNIRVEDILYFEAVGELVFAYLEQSMYEIHRRLYQVEASLQQSYIRRASKSMLINVDRIISVRSALNGRLYAKMENGEDVLISRNYAKQIANCIMEDYDEGI